MQFEISHSQQTRAAADVEQFRASQNSIFTTLEANLVSAMAKSYGSYNTAFHRVLVDVRDTQTQIGGLLDLMQTKMREASTAYQAGDETSAQDNSRVLAQLGSANNQYGIFN